MKKVVSFTLALVLVLGIAAMALAATTITLPNGKTVTVQGPNPLQKGAKGLAADVYAGLVAQTSQASGWTKDGNTQLAGFTCFRDGWR